MRRGALQLVTCRPLMPFGIGGGNEATAPEFRLAILTVLKCCAYPLSEPVIRAAVAPARSERQTQRALAQLICGGQVVRTMRAGCGMRGCLYELASVHSKGAAA